MAQKTPIELINDINTSEQLDLLLEGNTIESFLIKNDITNIKTIYSELIEMQKRLTKYVSKLTTNT